MVRKRTRKDKAGRAHEASEGSKPEAKTPTALKPEPKIAKISPKRDSTKSKESTSSAETEGEPEKTNMEHRKEKKVADNKKGNAQAKDQKDQNSKENLGGVVFMCNRNTKPDCFRYMVMGLPEGKRDFVMNIKPGLKLFLYDLDAKLLYGVYKASSGGGMKLEPSAFKGSYPAQVRFKVYMDCEPLPDDVFKKAIKENYDSRKNYFKTELTVQQVKKLVELFRPASQLQFNVLTTAPSYPVPALLAPPIPILPVVAPDDARRYDVPVHKDIAPTQREAVPRDHLPLSEKEYRMFGLKPPTSASAPAPVAPAPDTAYGSTNYPNAAVRYDPALRRTLYPSEQDMPRRVFYSSYPSELNNPIDLRHRYADEAQYPLPRGGEVDYGGLSTEAGRSHSAHAANVLSDYNKRHQIPGSRADLGSLPVSSRYSFAGAALQYR